MSAVQPASLSIRLATSKAEIVKAQELRYRVFYEGMGATPSLQVMLLERDFDAYDDCCDHLLVIDEARSDLHDPCVVGTYRLLRGAVAVRHSGYYSAGEFDLSKLDGYPGEHLELGRSCVDSNYRGKAAMQLLWRGIADYILEHNISLMFGCASFSGTDLDQMSSAMSLLRHNNLAPDGWRPKAQSDRYVSMNLLSEDAYDLRGAMRQMPPLIKGYLRLGAVIGDGAVVDHSFNTTDVCLLVETVNLTSRYVRHFMDDRNAEVARVSV